MLCSAEGSICQESRPQSAEAGIADYKPFCYRREQSSLRYSVAASLRPESDSSTCITRKTVV